MSDIHLVPRDGYDHSTSISCECMPVLTVACNNPDCPGCGKLMVIHKSVDPSVPEPALPYVHKMRMRVEGSGN